MRVLKNGVIAIPVSHHFCIRPNPHQCNQKGNLIGAKLYPKISFIKYFKVELFVTIS